MSESWVRLEPRTEIDGTPVEGYQFVLAIDFDPDWQEFSLTNADGAGRCCFRLMLADDMIDVIRELMTR